MSTKKGLFEQFTEKFGFGSNTPNWAADKIAGVTWNTDVFSPEQWRTFVEMGGKVSDSGVLTIGDMELGTLGTGTQGLTPPSAGGDFLGLSKDQWGGVGSAFGIGEGLFDIFNKSQMVKTAKDYYKDQIELQRKQMDMLKEEANRLKDDRARLNQGYTGA